MAPRESPRRSRDRPATHGHRSSRNPARFTSADGSQATSQGLSANSLAKLNQLNERSALEEEITPRKERRKRRREYIDEKIVVEKTRRRHHHKRRRRRDVSGALLEEGNGPRLRGIRGGDAYEDRGDEMTSKMKKRICEL